jgi:pimeloyl-ACP methyl ester carboxylesterase
MANYVLVHGGWHGGWCWRETEDVLRAKGHRVFCPTMTGLGERSHLIDSVEGPDTHVTDMVNVIRWNELDEIVLVGHSYGGMIITGVASQIPQRVKALVYLDAFVPTQDGQSAADLSIASRAAEIAKAAEGQDHVPPNGFERWTSSPDKLDWLTRLTTPHPRTCFGQGVSKITDPSTQSVERVYILCTQHNPSPFVQFHQRYQEDERWRCETIDCLHDAMVEKPVELANMLMRVVGQGG